jgi:hypothetical protein
LAPRSAFYAIKTRRPWNTFSIVAPPVLDIWDHATQYLRRTHRDQRSITNTIRNWGPGPYKCQILNRIWQLLPGFIVWQLWKERNRRIFHSKPSTPASLWSTILLNLQETLQLQPWTKDDQPSDPAELLILNSWGLKLSSTFSPPPLPPLPY